LGKELKKKNEGEWMGKKEIPGSGWSMHGYILTSRFYRENIVSAGFYPSGATFYLILCIHFFHDLTQ